MLTEAQKLQLENKIYNLIKEGMFENAFMENAFYEGEKDNNTTGDKTSSDDNSTVRVQVQKWLDSAQQLHSQLAYRLWPDMNEDEARSLFSKKYRGEDASGKEYSFDDDEMNSLYNMKDKFISQITGIGKNKSSD